ncbi:MAG: CbiX/SirB N-terminal domain-containing protein [Rhodoferax sp.]|jgi:sirohydrochlorin cobaltochelatase|nr:CbiX/SirB N-terminal domain-containing protein [Rhodoferax sp.]
MQNTILFGHGSRDPAWRIPIDRVAERMRAIDPQCGVRCAFLELTEPDIKQVATELVANGVTHITVLPMFLGVGRHAREDLPLLVQELQVKYPKVEFELKPSVGEEPLVIEVLAKLALEPRSQGPSEARTTT